MLSDGVAISLTVLGIAYPFGLQVGGKAASQ